MHVGSLWNGNPHVTHVMATFIAKTIIIGKSYLSRSANSTDSNVMVGSVCSSGNVSGNGSGMGRRRESGRAGQGSDESEIKPRTACQDID